MAWLTRSNVRQDVEAKVREIAAKIDARRSVAADEYEHEQIARIVSQSLAAGTALKKEWFYSSVGIDWGDEDGGETWYVSRAPIAASFVQEYVVHWTHWIGRLCTQIREHIEEHGSFPKILEYGPKNLEHRKNIGPSVRYKFADGRLLDFAFFDAEGTFTPTVDARAKAEIEETDKELARPSFGLKDIVELRDLAQDDQIRGPMAGIYILTGGPGVGKTSVALHRIPYLLLEQANQLQAEEPYAPTSFFQSDSVHVVVWKEHLVPYLKQCLAELQFGNVAVHHVEDWIARALRDYVRFGQKKGQYQKELSDEPDGVRRMKMGFADGDPSQRWAGLNETMLSSFLTDRADGKFHNPLAHELTEVIQDGLAEVDAGFESAPLRPTFRDPSPWFLPTVAGVDAVIQSVRDDLDQLAEKVTQAIERTQDTAQRRRFGTVRPLIRLARDAVTDLRERLLDLLSKDYPRLLGEFYRSGIVREVLAKRFGQDSVDHFTEDSCGRIDSRRLTRFDRYLLAWLVHIVTRGASGKNRAAPLPLYSHTVLDEAQYYHPLVLRLLVALAKPPLQSMTIVGDLEQKVTSDGGLVSWDDADITVERSKVFRLNTNYRWSKAVFKFLDIYRRLVGLSELKEPRRWVSGEGQFPAIVHCHTEADQISWLVDRVSALKLEDWTIAVVVPPESEQDWRDAVIDGLESLDIRSRWAIGEDVRECDEKVILTNYENIVGLEFDAVLLPGCEQVLAPPSPNREAILSAWVALTRARKHVGVSHVGKIAIFDDDQFQAYKSAFSPETQ